jgi:hypothetical protein
LNIGFPSAAANVPMSQPQPAIANKILSFTSSV